MPHKPRTATPSAPQTAPQMTHACQETSRRCVQLAWDLKQVQGWRRWLCAKRAFVLTDGALLICGRGQCARLCYCWQKGSWADSHCSHVWRYLETSRWEHRCVVLIAFIRHNQGQKRTDVLTIPSSHA